MTAIAKVKKRLWMSDYKVDDITSIKFIQGYDLVVEKIYRVAVREKKLQTDFKPNKLDILAVVDGKKIIFYKHPWILNKKLCAEVVDTSPLNIFIKHESRKHTSRSLRRKTTKSKQNSRGHKGR